MITKTSFYLALCVGKTFAKWQIFSLMSIIPVFANDDSHIYQFEAGVAATMIQAEELTISAVMNALKAGCFYGTTGPLIHQIENRNNQEIIVHCSPAESVIFYSDAPWASGRSVIKPGITECNYFVQKNEHFIRVEIRDSAGKKAWSSPIKV